jgi:hypothetical protein
VEVIRKSGFPEDAIKDGLRQAVEPVRTRIKALCKAAENSAESDPVHADKACRQLLDNAIPLLDGLDSLLPAGDPTRDVAHDDVAEQALRCQVAFAKKTHNWSVSVELLEWAAVVASSGSVSKKLKENLETVQKNADTNDDFCGEGYYDLPAPVLAEMEAARKLAEAQEFDGAISKLEDLLRGYSAGTLHSSQAPLVNKALAYCLGSRAARRRSGAIDIWNAHRPSVIDDIVKRVDAIDNVTWACAEMETIPPNMDCRCMADGRLIYGQYSIIKWTFKDKPVALVVCGSCGDRYRSQMNSARGALKEAIRQSAQDYADAAELDPTNNFVRGALERIRKECADLEIPVPGARKRKVKTTKEKPGAVSPSAPVSTSEMPFAIEPELAGWSLGLGLFSAAWAFVVWNVAHSAGVETTWTLGLAAAFPAVVAIILGHCSINRIAKSTAKDGTAKTMTGLVFGYGVALVVALLTLIQSPLM